MSSRDQLDRPTAPGCTLCAAALHHCHGTLVLHADGTAECDDLHHCEAREDVHEWWLPCSDLGCGCAGDEHPLGLELLAA